MDSTENQQRNGVVSDTLLGWLVGKLAHAEVELKMREDAAEIWRHGSDESWRAAAALHPSTAGKTLSCASRYHEAKAQARIASRCRTDVENYRAVLAALGHSNTLL